MLDTGSTISAMNAEYAKKININDRIQPTSTSCRTADNGRLHVLGRLTLPITINAIQFPINIFIIEDLCADLLLGGDFFSKYNGNIKYKEKQLTINRGYQQANVQFQQQFRIAQVFNVKTNAEMVLPPQGSKLIAAITESRPMQAIFSPSLGKWRKQHVVAPHVIVTVNKDKSTIMTLLNTSQSLVTIPKGTKLGYLNQYLNNHCCYVHPNDREKHQHCVSSVIKNSRQQQTRNETTIPSQLNSLLEHLTKAQQEEISPVLLKHSSMFDTSQPSVITNDNVSHRIPIQPHHPPIQSYPYRKAVKETQIINDQVKLMLDNHIIRPSSTPWSSPVVIIKKKDGSPRFCVDNRRLNSITERDVYPLLRIDDIVDRLAGSRFLTTLDLKAGYWQIPVDEEDKKKKAFVTTDGLFEFNVLPIGLSNAPASFQRTINSRGKYPKCSLALRLIF